MNRDSSQIRFRAIAAVAAAALVVLPTSANAGIFEQLFGGLRRVIEAPRVQAYAPTAPANEAARPGYYSVPQQYREAHESGPASAFCVRTCDGRFFPVRAQAGMTAAQACHAFCPSSETRLYSGSGIDHAVASDGSRYADLPNAFLYRKEIVAGCTCNGRTPFGLAQIDAKADPTLKPGDVIATQQGLEAFTGRKTSEFTPVQDYGGFSKSYRAQLSAMKIMPANPGAPAPVVSSLEPHRTASRAAERRADNER